MKLNVEHFLSYIEKTIDEQVLNNELTITNKVMVNSENELLQCYEVNNIENPEVQESYVVVVDNVNKNPYGKYKAYFIKIIQTDYGIILNYRTLLASAEPDLKTLYFDYHDPSHIRRLLIPVEEMGGTRYTINLDDKGEIYNINRKHIKLNKNLDMMKTFERNMDVNLKVFIKAKKVPDEKFQRNYFRVDPMEEEAYKMYITIMNFKNED